MNEIKREMEEKEMRIKEFEKMKKEIRAIAELKKKADIIEEKLNVEIQKNREMAKEICLMRNELAGKKNIKYIDHF